MFDTHKVGIYPPQTAWLRLRLLFKPKLYSWDVTPESRTTITYKVLNDVIYILKEDTAPTNSNNERES